MVLRVFLGILILASVSLCAHELNRWRDDAYRRSLSRQQKVRRLIGSFLLIFILAMAFGGTYFPTVGVTPLLFSIFMIYWLTCLMLAVCLLPVAYLEAKESLLRYAGERREMRRQALDGMDDLIHQALAGSQKADKPKKSKPQK